MASLAQTNKYLATPEQRQKAVRVTIATSSAIEGIHAPFKGAAKGAKATAKSAGKTTVNKVMVKAVSAKKVVRPAKVHGSPIKC